MSRFQVHPAHRIQTALAFVFALVLAGCAGSGDGTAGDGVGLLALEGARIITGDGSPAIEDGTVLVHDGRIQWVGSSADADVPSGADRVAMQGKTIMPTLVNAHVHLASDRAQREDQLRHMAYWGAGAVISLGLDEGDVGLAMRAESLPDGARSQSAGRGITSPEPGRSEVPHWVTSEDEARAAVRELAGQGVDFVKIWVDSRGGQYERLSPELYGAVIDEAHANGLRVTAHVFTLGDAKGLLRAGIDAFAHGIRDMDVDDELMTLWAERPEVVLVPNLPNPGVPVDLGWLAPTTAEETLEEMQEAASRENPAAQEAFGIQARNLARLHGAGVKVAFGTDGSSPWAVHMEMEDMVRAGMSPRDVIHAATGQSAELLRLTDTGTLAQGKSADFVVLDANPLDDITNTRAVSAVYLRGLEIDRTSLAARFRSGG